MHYDNSDTIDRTKSVTGCQIKPTMHVDYSIGTRVRIDPSVIKDAPLGTITGVASSHIFFHYIIQLDAPLTTPGYLGWTAVSVSGCQLYPAGVETVDPPEP